MTQIAIPMPPLTRMAKRILRRFAGSSHGNIAVISALVFPILVGSFGLGTEAVSWYSDQRSAQSAADSAAIAAASNAGADFADEARAVTAKYGFTDGVGGVTVSALNNQACPTGGNVCYQVRVSKIVPLLLAKVVGYAGDATLAGAPAKNIVATAVAIQGTSPRPYCVLALAGSGASPALRSNGAPAADLSGCNVLSNTGATCNGADLNADVGDAHGTNNGCGKARHSNMPVLSDPYTGLASGIPANTCGSYPQKPAKKGAALPAANQLAGVQAWAGTIEKCGDIQLTGPVTIDTGPSGAVLVIENGQLDTNGYSITTSSGSALTIIFSGTPGAYTHAPTGGGTLDIAAPKSGAWSGVAVYQDPSLTAGIDVSAAGNSPTWDITGLVYMPKASVTFSGAVNKASNGKSCFVLVVDNLLVNGTANILPKGECTQAGLSMPTSPVPSRGKLLS